jgi:quaternary ammonium compound-resistance protein SugE
MAWFYLLIAGLFEIGWAIGLKYTEGFTKPMRSLLAVGSMIVSLALLELALKTLPVGTAYAIWTGIGAVGIALPGAFSAVRFRSEGCLWHLGTGSSLSVPQLNSHFSTSSAVTCRRVA